MPLVEMCPKSMDDSVETEEDSSVPGTSKNSFIPDRQNASVTIRLKKSSRVDFLKLTPNEDTIKSLPEFTVDLISPNGKRQTYSPRDGDTVKVRTNCNYNT